MVTPFVMNHIIALAQDVSETEPLDQVKKGDKIEVVNLFNDVIIPSTLVRSVVKKSATTWYVNLNQRGIVKFYQNKDWSFRLVPDEKTDEELFVRLTDSKRFNTIVKRLQERKPPPLRNSGISLTKISTDLREETLSVVRAYARHFPPDYHPYSEGKVQDILHPSLYPLRLSKVPKLEQQTDFWNRPYENSKYQWLPSEVSVDAKGVCKFTSYINNLDARVGNDLQICLENLLSSSLPEMEKVWKYIKEVPLHTDESLDYFEKKKSRTIKPKQVRLKGSNLQVIVKIATVSLGNNEDLSGVWHVEGMSHENIVLSVVNVLEQQNIDSELRFKRTFTAEEAATLLQELPQDRPDYLNRYLGYNQGQQNEQKDSDTAVIPGLVPLGKFISGPGSRVVFPNSHIHKLDLRAEVAGKRTVVVFWLVNPLKRITSTHDVPRQQGKVTRKQAEKMRLELMEERTRHKENFNVRDLNLCEH